MKKLITILLCIMLIFTNTIISYSSDGDPNIDGGGGSTEDGTGTNKWMPGDDGVRVTIVRESSLSAATTPVDFTNRKPTFKFFFGLKSKLSYGTSSSLSPVDFTEYRFVNPATPIPSVVSSGGGGNIATLKKYFSDEGNLRGMCNQIGFDFDELTGGEYVIMLEPLVYITYNGIRFCMTATEAALYDRMTSGDLRSKLGNITHQNLPLAMFLEKPDIGFPAWGGATSGIRSNEEIISQLGIGTVRFSPDACCAHTLDCPCITDERHPNDCECKETHPGEDCSSDTPGCDCVPELDHDDPDGGTKYYDYHTDIDVITTIEVKDTQGAKSGISPDDNAYIRFDIDGDIISKPFVTPPLDSTQVWVRWHTPGTAKRIKISVTTSHGVVITPTVIANVSELVEDTPPDPDSRDTNKGFRVPRVPQNTEVTRLTWGEWIPKWHENWVWESNMVFESSGHDDSCPDDCGSSHGSWQDHGQYEDHGWWVYTWREYYGSASIESTVTPAKEVPTAIDHGYGNYTMKSGYGVNMLAKAMVQTSGKYSDCTEAQNTLATFPEFDYATYNRVMVPWSGNGLRYSEFTLAKNKYSFKGANSHYTPIWFPDGMDYTPQVQAIDIWTPAGMLSVSDAGDSIAIQGDCYDDWNIRPVT